LKVAQEEGAHFIDFHQPDQSGEINFPAGRVMKTTRFVKAVLEMDVVINAAKLKTHPYTGITAAVKNLFGCIPGLVKSQCHVRFARKEDFNLMLLDILQLVKPALNIVDAVAAMEGEGGPATGALRPMNLIVAGEDAVAVDSICAALTGRPPHAFGFLRSAAEGGVGETDLGKIKILGEKLEANIQRDFKHIGVLHPGMLPNWVPGFIGAILRRWLIDRPCLIKSKCKKCGACQKVCATGAITLVGGRPKFNYSKCISCFCCQEMCKYSALKIRKSFLARVVLFLVASYNRFIF
jgi:ferredoxin